MIKKFYSNQKNLFFENSAISVNNEFENSLKHKNYIFSNSIDLVQEFFNFERKFNNNILSKSLKILGKNRFVNKLFTKVADKGINF